MIEKIAAVLLSAVGAWFAWSIVEIGFLRSPSAANLIVWFFETF
jgi:hypothetical protein